MNINLVYDGDVSSAPAGFKTALNSVVQLLDSMLSDNINVSIEVGWGSIGSVAGGDYQTVPANESLGGPNGGQFVSLSTLKPLLAAHGTSADDATALASLGIDQATLAADSATTGNTIYLSAAQCKALGLSTSSTYDGEVGFGAGSTAYNFNLNNRSGAGWDFFGVAMHEITHALGRFAYLNTSPTALSLMDLYRYSGSGQRALTNGASAYFSINGGVTNLANFATSSDVGDWGAGPISDSYSAFSGNGPNNMTSYDVRLLDVLGFTLANFSAATAISKMNSPLPDLWLPILDSGTNIGAQIDSIKTIASAGSLASLRVSDTSAIGITQAQLTSDASVLSAITNQYGLQVALSSTLSYTLGANCTAMTVTGNAGANLTANALGDTLTGDGFYCQFIGGAGNDVLRTGTGGGYIDGGAGADIIQGGSGNDTIVYHANDVTVDGGAGNNTLLLLGGQLPTSFNLSANHFNQAEQTVQSSGGQWWSQYSDYYSTAWQLTNQTGTATDGRNWSAGFDTTYQWWSNFTDWFSVSGQHTNQSGTADDGRYWTTQYDYTGSNWWSSYTEWYNSSGQHINEQGTADDGRYWTTTYDANNQNVWASFTNMSNAQGQLLAVYGTYHNGQAWTGQP